MERWDDVENTLWELATFRNLKYVIHPPSYSIKYQAWNLLEEGPQKLKSLLKLPQFEHDDA